MPGFWTVELSGSIRPLPRISDPGPDVLGSAQEEAPRFALESQGRVALLAVATMLG